MSTPDTYGPVALPLTVPIPAMRDPVLRGATGGRAWRLEQLQRLEALLREATGALPEALARDLDKPATEAVMEVLTVRQELRHTRRHLGRWMRERGVTVPAWARPGAAAIRPVPLGCVLILSPWNYPFQLCLHPLVSALAAGNTAVLKPSELAPCTAALIAELVPRHFPPEVVQVVCGDGTVAARLLEERFDHVFFTGGTRVGRLVMTAAARHLTPVTLELGGRSPAIVLEDAALAPTARRLAWGKILNAGQTCVAPDHVYVVPAAREPLLAALAGEIRRMLGPDPLASGDLGRIVDRAHFLRLEGLLEGARRRGQVVTGGRSDAATCRIEPTVLAVDPAGEDPLVEEELFGPLLPVMAVADLEEAVERVRRAPPPLALYLFGGGRSEQERLLAGTRSGSVAFNDVVVQAALPDLPFGGVGESGMGNYHGEAGFRTFSHQRSVLRRPFWLDAPFRYPPYGARRKVLLERLLG